jgi:hypothetical protein
VHGEELVVGVGAHELQLGAGQLGAHDQREPAADAEEAERGDDVQQADPLVVHGDDPANQT